MCGAVPIIGAVVGSLMSGLFGGNKSPEPPKVQSYAPEVQALDITPPPPPNEAPAFGQKSADEMRKDAETDAVRKNKKGLSALRIDRDPVTGVSGAGQVGSGTVVPRG